MAATLTDKSKRRVGLIELNKIYNEDCCSTMSRMEDGSVDLVYADPPFNTGDAIGWYNRSYGDNSNDKLTKVEYAEFCRTWFDEARRIAKRLVITPGVGNVGLYPNPFWIVSIRKPSSPSFNRCGGFNCWEPLFLYDAPLKRLPRDEVEYDSMNFIKDGREKHPCPDNHKMVEWIVDMWTTRDGDVVYDPFLGSGTTAVAAERLGRNWVGSEINPDYVKIAERRISNERAQFKLAL